MGVKGVDNMLKETNKKNEEMEVQKSSKINGEIENIKKMSPDNQRFLYEKILEGINFTKKQEWLIAYYVVILQAALFKVHQIASVTDLNNILTAASCIISTAGILFLIGYCHTRNEYRESVYTIKGIMSGKDDKCLEEYIDKEIKHDHRAIFEKFIYFCFIAAFILSATIVIKYIN
jgi:hypothetical protein